MPLQHTDVRMKNWKLKQTKTEKKDSANIFELSNDNLIMNEPESYMDGDKLFFQNQ